MSGYRLIKSTKSGKPPNDTIGSLSVVALDPNNFPPWVPAYSGHDRTILLRCILSTFESRSGVWSINLRERVLILFHVSRCFIGSII